MVRHLAHEVNQKYDFFRPHLAASLKAMIAPHRPQVDNFPVPSRTLGNHKNAQDQASASVQNGFPNLVVQALP